MWLHNLNGNTNIKTEKSVMQWKTQVDNIIGNYKYKVKLFPNGFSAA